MAKSKQKSKHKPKVKPSVPVVPEAPLPQTAKEVLALQVFQFKECFRPNVDLFHSPDGAAYATVKVKGHFETWLIRSNEFKKLLRHQWFIRAKTVTPIWVLGMPIPMPTAIPKEVLNDMLNEAEATAQFEGDERPVFLRVGAHNGDVFIDLADDQWRVIRITADNWMIEESSTAARFVRRQGMLPLPRPIRDENALQNLDALLTNLDADGRVLYKCFLLGCLNPAGPYAVLVVTGEHGSTKSTICRVVRTLIDPSKAPLTTAPKNERDLQIAASKSWLQAFDNVSEINKEMSDNLCRLATGGGLRTRKLFTDDDEMIFDAIRPILINSIVDSVVTAPDLADRVLGIHTRGKPAHYKDEKTFWTEFDSMRAGIFGLLCDAVQEALSKQASVDVSALPRMADFARWVIAGETKLGLQPGDYMKAVVRNQQSQVFNALDASAIYQPLLDFVQLKPQYLQSGAEGWDQDVWKGDMPKLLARLKQHLGSSPRGFPGSASELRAQLNRIIPALRAIDNIEITFPGLDSRTRRRQVEIVRPPQPPPVSNRELRRQEFIKQNPEYAQNSVKDVEAAIKASPAQKFVEKQDRHKAEARAFAEAHPDIFPPESLPVTKPVSDEVAKRPSQPSQPLQQLAKKVQ